MCGLYGYVGHPPTKAKRKQTARLMEMLIYYTKIRGEHSTGYAAATENEFLLEKNAVSPTEFIKLAHWRQTIVKDRAYIFMGHNRWASVGAINYQNSHPFEGKNFILAMNGTSRSALQAVKTRGLVTRMEGDTDSEAILQLLDVDGVERLPELCESLEDFSLTIIDKHTEEVLFARNENKPLYIADLREGKTPNSLGIRVWSSTPDIMCKALTAAGIDPTTVYGFNTKPGYIYTLSAQDDTLEVNRGFHFKTQVIMRQPAIQRLPIPTKGMRQLRLNPPPPIMDPHTNSLLDDEQYRRDMANLSHRNQKIIEDWERSYGAEQHAGDSRVQRVRGWDYELKKFNHLNKTMKGGKKDDDKSADQEVDDFLGDEGEPFK